jgi:hypothetical protein
VKNTQKNAAKGTLKIKLRPKALLVMLAGASVLACGTSSSSPTSSSYPTYNDASEDESAPLPDAPSYPIDVAPETAATQAFVRLAAWSPDEVAIDFCVAPHGTTMYEGPLVAQLAASDDAGATDAEAAPPGLAFPEVTAYVALAPQQYDVTIVAGGSASCTGGSLEATALALLVAGSHTTFALVGDAETAVVGDAQTAGGDPALSLVAFSDDTGTRSPAGGASLRFINASPSVSAADLGSGSLQDSNFEDLFTDVAFAKAGSQTAADSGTIDGNGYLGCGPLTSVVLSAHASAGAADAADATGDLAVAYGVETQFGTVTTIALVGGKTGDSTNPAQLVQCADGDVAGWLSACASISP